MQRNAVFFRRRPGAILAALLVVAYVSTLGSCGSGAPVAESSAPAPAKPGPTDRAAKWETAKGSALIVMDLQKAFWPVLRQSAIVANVNRLVAAADAAGAPVVWVYTDNSWAPRGTNVYQLADPFKPAPQHLEVVKSGASAFSGTDLEELLEARGIGRVVFCGLASNGCVRASVSGAYALGYLTAIAEDAHTVPSGSGNMADVDAATRSWKDSGCFEVLPSARISFRTPSALRYGLGEEDWPLTQGFASFLDSTYRTIVARLPESATQLGLSEWAGLDDTKLEGLSAKYLEENRRIEREALAALDAYDRSGMSAGDALSAAAFRRELADSVALHEFADMNYLVNPTVFGVAYQIDSLFSSVCPVGTPKEAEAYVQRLEALGAKVDEAVGAMKRREAKKAFAPQVVLQRALPDLQAVTRESVESTMFYTVLEKGLGNMAGLEESQKAALLSRARKAISGKVIPAYGRLAAAVEKHISKAPAELGLWTMPDGERFYRALLKQRTTTDLTPEQIHELGLEALKRIHADIVAVAARSGGRLTGTTAQQVVGSAFAARNAVGPTEALSWYTARLKETEEFLKTQLVDYPSAPVEIRTARQGGYYQPGAIDGSRPGAFYVAEGAGANLAGMPTLLYHETVPGHHLQIATAHGLELPVARKIMFFEAYAEGWALYAERMMAELGAYDDDPVGDVGRLQLEAMRAARLVVDTGIHAMKWTQAQAVDFMTNQGLLARQAAQGEVIRYASIPAQATSYYVGFLKILELRERARSALGERFSLPAFHRTILSCGALPLDVLETVVDRYIAEAGAGR